MSLAGIRAQDTVDICSADSMFYQDYPFKLIYETSYLVSGGGVSQYQISNGDTVCFSFSCIANEYIAPQRGIPIYGVRMPLIVESELLPFLYQFMPVVIQMTEDGRYYRQLGRARELNRLNNFPYDCYIKASYHPECDSTADTVVGGYNMYFDSPILVKDTFYCGFTMVGPHTFLHTDAVNSYGLTFSCSDTNNLPFPSDDSFMNSTSRVFQSNNFHGEYVEEYSGSGGAYILMSPIVYPPDMDTQAVGCPGIESFQYAGIMAGYPTFVWETSGEHGQYEICYGPYDKEVDSLTHDTTSMGMYVLTERLNPDVYYQARCRAVCYCSSPLQDTVVWTDWSAPQYFYIGDSMPDTSHTPQEPEGIGAVGAGPVFSLSPNPADGTVRVELSGGAAVDAIVLHDAGGRQLKALKSERGVAEIDTRELSSGVYFVTVSSCPASSTRQLIISH